MIKIYKKIIITSLLYSLNLLANWQDKLKEKIKNNIKPEWMINQINSDLQMHKNGIYKVQLDKIMNDENKWLNALNLRIKIINNNIIIQHNMHLWPNLISDYIGPYIKGIMNRTLKMLDDLLKIAKIPDIDFVINLHDDISFHNYSGPIFGLSKDKNEKNLILFPTLHINMLQQTEQGNKQYPWHKKENKAFWRGATTGGNYELNNYNTYTRTKCVELSIKYPELIDARFTSTVQSSPDVKELFKKLNYLGNYCFIEDHIKYKYQILIDGNTTTWGRAYWQLFSNSVIFKQNSNKIQWYYEGLKPWIHYIPIENDISDLPEKIKWALNNDEKAYEISQNAQKFAHENLNYESILYYIYLLLTEYSKLQKFIVD